MPFNPALPADNTEIDAPDLRAQFNALNDLITAQTAQLTTQAAQIAALEAAVSGTALNPNLSSLSIFIDDPPTRQQAQAMLDQLNTLLNQLTRV